jgi:hypothetical protein
LGGQGKPMKGSGKKLKKTRFSITSGKSHVFVKHYGMLLMEGELFGTRFGFLAFGRYFKCLREEGGVQVLCRPRYQ